MWNIREDSEPLVQRRWRGTVSAVVTCELPMLTPAVGFSDGTLFHFSPFSIFHLPILRRCTFSLSSIFQSSLCQCPQTLMPMARRQPPHGRRLGPKRLVGPSRPPRRQCRVCLGSRFGERLVRLHGAVSDPTASSFRARQTRRSAMPAHVSICRKDGHTTSRNPNPGSALAFRLRRHSVAFQTQFLRRPAPARLLCLSPVPPRASIRGS
jgi:hypothetical protein